MDEHLQRLRALATIVFAVMVVLGAGIAGVYGAVRWTIPQPASAVSANTLELALPASALKGRAAILLEVNTGRVIYQRDAYEQLPLASLTKMMATEVVLSQRPPDTPVLI